MQYLLDLLKFHIVRVQAATLLYAGNDDNLRQGVL